MFFTWKQIEMMFFYFFKFIFDIKHQNDLKISKKNWKKLNFYKSVFKLEKKKSSFVVVDYFCWILPEIFRCITYIFTMIYRNHFLQTVFCILDGRMNYLCFYEIELIYGKNYLPSRWPLLVQPVLLLLLKN